MNQPSPELQEPQAQAAPSAPSGVPVTQQQNKRARRRWPAWAQQLPYFKLPPADPNFTLISRAAIAPALEKSGLRPQRAVMADIETDLRVLEEELIPLFRKRDRAAKVSQNNYRLVQLGFIVLATLATVLGALLALSQNGAPELVPLFAFGETAVALFAAFLAAISTSSRETPFAAWLRNRRIAESLRREYFRYLMRMPPYDSLEGFQRPYQLGVRAAIINRGDNPDFPPNRDGASSGVNSQP